MSYLTYFAAVISEQVLTRFSLQRLPSKVIFHQRLSSIKDHLLSTVIFYDWSYILSSIKVCLPS